MRVAVLILLVSLTVTASASAANLETTAAVELITPATASLEQWDANDDPIWSLSGAPGQQLQVSLELRTTDGRRLAAGADLPLSLDPTGQILTTLAPPSAGPHDIAPVVTLVVCRE